MTQAKHTPGPWSVREAATHVAVIGANGEALFHDDKRPPLVMEDARLIAAAPTMLEALQDCREALRRAGAEGELRLIDAVICQVTGA